MTAQHDVVIDLIGDGVVELRRLARCFCAEAHRAALVGGWIARFRARAERAGTPPDLVDTVVDVIRAETVDWSGFGTELYR